MKKRRPNLFRSLRYRNYRLFFFGHGLSLIGTWIQAIATPWLVYRLTDSPFLLGLVVFAGQIPAFIIAPFAGVLCDRMNRRSLLLATQSLALLQALILAVLYFSGLLEIWHLVVLGIVLGTTAGFDMPIRQSFVIELIEKKSDIGNAIALNSSMVNATKLIGPSIAGILIAQFGEGACFALNAISYTVVIAAILMMKIPPRTATARKTKILHQLKEGVKYTFGFAPIRAIILLIAVVNLSGMSFAVIMPVFVREVLQSDATIYGILMGASGIGALAGAIYLASRKQTFKLGRMIPAATAVFGIGLIILSFARVPAISIAIMSVVGLGAILLLAGSNTVLQTIVEDDKRGRLMSFYAMAFMGVAPFGSLIVGTLTDAIGVQLTLIVCGLSCLTAAGFFAKHLPKFRKLLHPIYVKLGYVQEAATNLQSITDLTSSKTRPKK